LPNRTTAAFRIFFVAEELKTQEQFTSFASARVLHPAPANGFVHGSNDLSLVKVVERYPFRGPILPAVDRMGAFQQLSLIYCLGHHNRRGPIPHVGPTVADIRADAARNTQGDDAIAVAERYRLDVREARRLDLAQLIVDVLKRIGSDDLPSHLSSSRHAKNDESADAVEHTADGVHAFAALAGGFLEFHPIGFAAANEFAQLIDVHIYPTPQKSSATSRFSLRANSILISLRRRRLGRRTGRSADWCSTPGDPFQHSFSLAIRRRT
jgi:hypothetical protein